MKILTAGEAMIIADQNIKNIIPEIMQQIQLEASKGNCKIKVAHISDALNKLLKENGYAVSHDYGMMTGDEYTISWSAAIK